MGSDNEMNIQRALQEQVNLFNKHKKERAQQAKELDEEPGIYMRCMSCKKRFKNYRMATLCPTCFELEKNRYNELRDYLYTHPGTRIEVLCDKFGVSRASIRKYLREYKIEIAGTDKSYFLLCKRCREPIKTGEYCDKCESLSGKKVISKQQEINTDFHSKR